MSNPISDPLVENLDTDVTSDLVRIEATEAGAATVWINRPAKKNAFNSETIAALREAFETLHAQDGIRIVFVRGAGGAFSAGADLDWMRDAAILTEADNHADAMELARMLKTLHDLNPLTVALVEGPAFGGGAGLVAACDMAIATSDARFAFSEVKLGLIPATVSPYVVAAIGPRAARALFATGRIFDAGHAEKIGLVDEVVDDATALEHVQSLLSALPSQIAGSGSRIGARRCPVKRILDRCQEASHTLAHLPDLTQQSAVIVIGVRIPRIDAQ